MAIFWNGDIEGLTHEKFWPTQVEKFDHETQVLLLDYAIECYGEKAYRNIDRAEGWKKRLQELLADQHPNADQSNDL